MNTEHIKTYISNTASSEKEREIVLEILIELINYYETPPALRSMAMQITRHQNHYWIRKMNLTETNVSKLGNYSNILKKYKSNE